MDNKGKLSVSLHTWVNLVYLKTMWSTCRSIKSLSLPDVGESGKGVWELHFVSRSVLNCGIILL